MTDRATLLALADRAEAAEGASLVLERDIALAIYPGAFAVHGNETRISVWDGNGRTQLTVKPYSASLDAAMTLVPDNALFTARTVWDGDRATGLANVSRYEVGSPKDALRRYWMDEHQTIGATPALALCAAALRARAETAQ